MKSFDVDTIAGFWRSGKGAVAPIAALLLVLSIGITGFAVDVGHVMWVQRQLQSAADAAVLAGAVDVVKAPGNAVTLANTYSAKNGAKNAFLGSAVTTTATLKCLTSVTFPTCAAGSGTYNAIQVTQQAVVPMWFSQILGVANMTVTAQATASAKGGQALPLDVMIVLDNTGSMNSWDNHCTGGNTRIKCAKYGVQVLLNALNPAVDQVGVMVFPGYKTQTQASSQGTCSPTTSSNAISKYAPYRANSAPYYTVASLSNSFKANSSATKLDTSSSLVIASGAGTCGSNGGIQAVGGVGTSYAQAILGAETVLANNGNSKSQKVIVFLSDGDANASSSNSQGGFNVNNQCQQAVAAAQAAAAQGMWVYSIAYGASTSGGNNSCSTDKSNLGTTVVAGYSTTVSGKGKSACWTMAAIASDPSKFYSDNAGGCIGTGGTDNDLTQLFKDIAASLTRPRLVPNNSL